MYSLLFTFSEFLGFLMVMVIVTIGFWLLLFLVGLLPYWIGGALRERMLERREEKRQGK